jgi:hypothetical protein
MDNADSNLSSSAPAAQQDAGYSWRKILVRHWRESVRYFGLWRALRELNRLRCGKLDLAIDGALTSTARFMAFNN